MSYVENVLLSYITEFQKLHDSQPWIIRMLENCKNALAKNEFLCDLFMDLSDTINHNIKI